MCSVARTNTKTRREAAKIATPKTSNKTPANRRHVAIFRLALESVPED
ncbi:MAG: hypothetical protein K8T25_07160 [Planctomycetia bacterium]|nr:hypothetical protein [Planctomycetia bacterium]